MKLHTKTLLGLLRTINNPFYFLYRCFHYMEKYVPLKLSTFIANYNFRKTYSGEIILETYDGSRQFCHPDMLRCNGHNLLVVTPYPYAMEEYENPCLYKETLVGYVMISEAPIDMPQKHKIGNHLSDPCIVSKESQILCFYRSSEKIKGVELNKILLKEFNLEKLQASDSKLIIESTTDDLLSPAIVTVNNSYWMYYAKKNLDCKLCLLQLADDYKVIGNTEVTIQGMPVDSKIWHLGVVFEKNFMKNGNNGEKLNGIFLVIDKNSQKRLFLASSNGICSDWSLSKELKLPTEIETDCKFVYKSCFVPDTDEVLISFRDMKDRYHVIRLSISKAIRK